MFAPFSRLKHFNLTGNLIKNIDYLVKAPFKDIEGIYLIEN